MRKTKNSRAFIVQVVQLIQNFLFFQDIPDYISEEIKFILITQIKASTSNLQILIPFLQLKFLKNKRMFDSSKNNIQSVKQEYVPSKSQFQRNLSSYSGVSSTFSRNLQSPKAFQRKPSFKAYQKRQKRVTQMAQRICYISPEKSQIFKKLSSQISVDNISLANTSKASQKSLSSFQVPDSIGGYKQPFPRLKFQDQSSITNDLSNRNNQAFQPHKNTKTGNIHKVSERVFKQKFKTQQKTDQSGQQSFRSSISVFEQDFFSQQTASSKKLNILEKKPSLQFGSHTSNNFYQSQFHTPVTVLKQKKTQTLSDSLKQENNQLRKNNQILKQQLQKNIYQKNQLQQSSKMFLNQIKNLQQLCNVKPQQIQLYKQNISLLSKQVNMFKNQLKRQISDRDQIQCQYLKQMNHLRDQIQKLNSDLQYIIIEKDMLRKKLDQNQNVYCQVNRLQTLNKKLSGKVKFLTKQIDLLEKQNQSVNVKRQRKVLCDTKNHKYEQGQQKILKSSLLNQVPYTPMKKRSLKSVQDQQILFQLSPDKSDYPHCNRWDSKKGKF